MSPLQLWMRRQAAREQRVVVLEEGLVGGRLWSYSRYRLRFSILASLIESLAHAVMVLLLSHGLAWDNFLVVVLAHSGTVLASGMWWGALEHMRGQVRDLHRSGKAHRVPRMVAGWLTLAFLCALAIAVLAAGWAAWSASAGRFGVTEAYVTALLLRVAIGMPTRCYHSGVYALRRVYKPLAATLAPEFLGLAVMLTLWPVAGVWALVVSTVLVTTVVTAFSWHYTHRAYRFLGLDPLRHVGRQALQESLRGAARQSLAAGTAYAVTALDSLVVIALLYGSQAGSDSLFLLFLLAPTIRAGADWGRVLYFDLKRLELRLFSNLRRRFEQHTAHLACLLGLGFWGYAAAIATVFSGHSLGRLYGALLVFFVARSFLARGQIQAYAARAYAPVLATGLLCVAGLAGVSVLAQTEAQRLTAIALVTGASALVLEWLARSARARAASTALVPLEWLARLSQVRGPVRVGCARVIAPSSMERLDARSLAERNRGRLGEIAELAAAELEAAGAAMWAGPDRVVWFDTSEEPRITAQWLQRTSGGVVAEAPTRDCANGVLACRAAGEAGFLGRASRHVLAADGVVDPADVGQAFLDLVPDGIVYSPDAPVPAALAALPKADLRAVLADAIAFARDLDTGRQRSRFDVTALCSDGELRLIFVASPHAGRKVRARWREQVTELNVRAAVTGPAVAAPDRDGRRAPAPSVPRVAACYASTSDCSSL